MSRLRMLILSFCITTPVVADHSKSGDHIGANPAYDTREGGEDISTAIEIPNFPFTDTGATCDNIDDYDEVCPYTGSTSPDVVYKVHSNHWDWVNIDLCLSSYDTKLYTYDEDLNLLDCSDDYIDCTNAFRSQLDLVLCPGGTYYIVVDGYGGDCGEYALSIAQYSVPPPPPPPVLVCPVGGILEGEPELIDGYIDLYNGGCDAQTPIFQPLSPAPDETALFLCGISGWFETADEIRQDSDWFEIVATGAELVIISEEEVATTVSHVDVSDCNDINEYDYHLHFENISSPVAAQNATWGDVKSVYR
jgi:hypothetical protein